MFDSAQTKNIDLELENEKNKRTIENLNKKVNEIKINNQKNIEIINTWKDLFYHQLGVSEDWKKKYHNEIVK